MWDKLFSSVDLLQKGMQASWTRNAVLRNNVANAETPGFKASDVEFESVFANTVQSIADGGGFKAKMTRNKHINFDDPSQVDYRVVEDTSRAMLFNENGVDVEAEQVKLAQNSIYYNTLTAKLNSELMRIKTAIREGK